MTRNLLFLPIIVLILIFSLNAAHADVLIEDVDANASAAESQTSIQIETGIGEPGNFVLFSCATTFTDAGNALNDPSPEVWTEIDKGPCSIDQGPQFCLHGIWGGFTENPNSENITCSWTVNTNVSVAGSFRYTGVDPINPIIGVDCNTGFGNVSIAPSIQTEAGSQVVRIFTQGNFRDVAAAQTPENEANADPTGAYLASATGNFAFISSLGQSVLFTEAGPTGSQDSLLPQIERWRACTIALRMEIIQRDVPTMSEWGLISFAAFAGIAGFWFIRRRQLAA